MDKKLSVLQEEITSEYLFRPAKREDMLLLHGLLQEIEAIEERGWLSSLEDRFRDFDEDKDPDRNSLLAFDRDGKMVGFSWPEAPDKDAQLEYRAFVWVEVHPAHRANGLGSFMLEWGEKRSRELFSSLPTDLPKVMRFGISKGLAYETELYEQAGYSPIRYFYHMHRDLSLPVPEPILPEGITLVRWSQELDEQCLSVFNSSFLDHWGFEPIHYDRWKLWFSGHPDFLPDCTFLAVVENRVVSICISALRRIGKIDAPESVGWIRDVGTLREYRGRGIATGLMHAALLAFKERRFRKAGLGVDTENPTGALRIYEQMGFIPARFTTMYEKRVG